MVMLHLRSVSHHLGVSVGLKNTNSPGPTAALQHFWIIETTHRIWCIQTSASGAKEGTKDLISTPKELSPMPKAALTSLRTSLFESRRLVLLAGTCKCSSLCFKNCFSGFEEG